MGTALVGVVVAFNVAFVTVYLVLLVRKHFMIYAKVKDIESFSTAVGNTFQSVQNAVEQLEQRIGKLENGQVVHAKGTIGYQQEG